MKYKCLRNFTCNGVLGVPGKLLGAEEVSRIGDLLPSLVHTELLIGLEEEKKDDLLSDIKKELEWDVVKERLQEQENKKTKKKKKSE